MMWIGKGSVSRCRKEKNAMETQSTSLGAGGWFGILISLALTVIVVVAWWKVFVKAGQPGWACLIPFYNIIVELRIIGKPWWWLLLLFVPFVNIVIAIIMMLELSKVFGHGVGFGLGLIFLSLFFMIYLGFSSDRYLGPGGVRSATVPAI
jgi:hypothetical protein